VVGTAAGGEAIGGGRIGIFGGTFDPPHIGHLIVAQDAWAALGLDRVLFVPAAAPPHKADRVITPAALRLELLRAAVAGDPRFEVSDLELRRAGPSYTVDTLRELHRLYPGTELFFLLGVDQFRDLHTWREPAEVARLATLVVVARGGEPVEPRPDLSYRLLEATRIDISATAIRERVRMGDPIRYLVPDGVAAAIGREGLYRV
jgi:nicotinate-nucleotide adenylyltransferase